jgi:general secretion pathway protein K
MGDRVTESRGERGARSERGVAILAVAVSIVFIAAITVEFDTNTNVDSIAAANATDDVRAHFLARSGINLGRLLIEVQVGILDRHKEQLGNAQIADFAPLIVGGFGGSPEEVQAVSQLLGGTQGDAIEGLGVSGGQFDLEMGTEDGKINVNCIGGASAQNAPVLRAQLAALLYFEAFNPLFERPDNEGWLRDRETQVAAIIDYVDQDRARDNAGGAPEDYGYETLRDRYEAKNNYLDTHGEIRQIRGVDDRFWTLFGDQLTVYGPCEIALREVTDPKLLAAVIQLSAKNPEDPVLGDPVRLWALAQIILEARKLGFMWDDAKQFADFVGDPAGTVGALVGGDPSSAAALVPGAEGLLQMLQQVQGIELDQAKLGQIVTFKPRQTYRLEVTAQIGPQRRRTIKKITAIWDTEVVPQNARSQGKGAWVFWKEE